MASKQGAEPDEKRPLETFLDKLDTGKLKYFPKISYFVNLVNALFHVTFPLIVIRLQKGKSSIVRLRCFRFNGGY